MQCKGIENIDRIILATSFLDSDAILEKYTLGGSVSFWKGEPEDVIDRYLTACDHYGLDVVVRITADCPLVFPEIINFLLDEHFASGADYTAAADCAVGTSGEIITVAALRRIKEHFGVAEYSEYMTWYFRNNAEHMKINVVQLADELVANYRMTLDYPEDLDMFETLFRILEPGKQIYTGKEIMESLRKNPEIAKINSHLTLKYKTDAELISILDEKTKMRQ
jgi:N,N'-diacetyllegionaminate synthase